MIRRQKCALELRGDAQLLYSALRVHRLLVEARGLDGPVGLRDHRVLQGGDENFNHLLIGGGTLSIALFALNLIPAPPLDGAAIVGNMSRTTHRFYYSEGMQRFGILFLVVIFATGIGSKVILWAKVGGLLYCILIARMVTSGAG